MHKPGDWQPILPLIQYFPGAGDKLSEASPSRAPLKISTPNVLVAVYKCQTG